MLVSQNQSHVPIPTSQWNPRSQIPVSNPEVAAGCDFPRAIGVNDSIETFFCIVFCFIFTLFYYYFFEILSQSHLRFKIVKKLFSENLGCSKIPEIPESRFFQELDIISQQSRSQSQIQLPHPSPKSQIQILH